VPGVQWRYGAVGNAQWRGVAVKDVLERAGVKATAKHLHAFGSDDPPGKVPPFHRSIELEKAMSDAILAYDMNGKPLETTHGAPLRLVVPGWAGDHWMKWLMRLSPQPEPQKGFYMETAYRYPNKPGAPGVTFKPEEMYHWTPRAAGKARLFARATDVRGSVQPREPVWNQSGYLFNGWHSADVEVTA
jgi:DMSO/TMAO reductase YedYZ molybdopterin-dependent catalytic subunit